MFTFYQVLLRRVLRSLGRERVPAILHRLKATVHHHALRTIQTGVAHPRLRTKRAITTTRAMNPNRMRHRHQLRMATAIIHQSMVTRCILPHQLLFMVMTLEHRMWIRMPGYPCHHRPSLQVIIMFVRRHLRLPTTDIVVVPLQAGLQRRPENTIGVQVGCNHLTPGTGDDDRFFSPPQKLKPSHALVCFNVSFNPLFLHACITLTLLVVGFYDLLQIFFFFPSLSLFFPIVRLRRSSIGS
jgi:hypothetical protein